MKNNVTAVIFITAMSLGHVQAQGTFIYDQQSVVNDFAFAEGIQTIQSAQPIGQSFTPSLNAVGFVRLALVDSALNAVGATVYVNLRSGSITGPILASTEPVGMPDNYGGATTFIFSNPVPVVPGTMLYFQPVVQSGDAWGIYHDRHYDYSGGTAFARGQPSLDYDLWFREGIYIPEPSSRSLLLIGASLVFYFRRVRTSK
jgi:hypothetical protein